MLDYDDLDQIEQAAELYESLHESRIVPEVDEELTQDELWGELRSLCARPMTGAEIWEEWQPLFGQFETSQHEALFAYTSDHFQLDVHDLRTLEQAFRFEVLRLNIEQMRDDGLEVMKPALGEEAMQRWEERAGVEVVEPLRTFVVEVSAGYRSDGEFGFFDFERLDLQADVFGHVIDDMARHDGEGHDWELDLLTRALTFFENNPDEHICNAAQARQVEPAPHHAPRKALVVGWYFEGNHGDYTDLIITEGPLAGEWIRFDAMVHFGRDQQRVRFIRFDVMRCIQEQYYIHMLGEEVWGECEELLEVFP